MQPLCPTLRACCLAGMVFVAPAMAQDIPPEMKSPKVVLTDVDWSAVHAALANIGMADTGDDPLASLNAATARVFANIATSPVPVLLPFDTTSYLRDTSKVGAGDISKYLSGFNAV